MGNFDSQFGKKTIAFADDAQITEIRFIWNQTFHIRRQKSVQQKTQKKTFFPSLMMIFLSCFCCLDPPVVDITPSNLTTNETSEVTIYCTYESNPTLLTAVRW